MVPREQIPFGAFLLSVNGSGEWKFLVHQKAKIRPNCSSEIVAKSPKLNHWKQHPVFLFFLWVQQVQWLLLWFWNFGSSWGVSDCWKLTPCKTLCSIQPGDRQNTESTSFLFTRMRQYSFVCGKLQHVLCATLPWLVCLLREANNFCD